MTVEHSTASKGETSVLSRASLQGCLEERLCQDDPIVLTPRERQFLELVAHQASTTASDEFVVPRKLLEAFLAANK